MDVCEDRLDIEAVGKENKNQAKEACRCFRTRIPNSRRPSMSREAFGLCAVKAGERFVPFRDVMVVWWADKDKPSQLAK
jgi:hypothetical protein